MKKSYEIGFDVGGTFTDLILRDLNSGEIFTHKLLTTPENPDEAALEGIKILLEKNEVEIKEIKNIYHATTLVANTIIEQKGSKVGLITTNGFRDILEMRTEQRYSIYDLFLKYPEPLCERYLRKGLTERITRDGDIIEKVNKEELKEIISFFKKMNVKSIAICLLHSYMNSKNEIIVRDQIKSNWKDVYISLSSLIAPEIKEYQRTVTTVANAYVLEKSNKYLHSIESNLLNLGYKNKIFIMNSAGGSTLLSDSANYPIKLVESGPAAGVLSSKYLGDLAGYKNLISFDMGGTTAKIGLILNGEPTIASSLEVARTNRFMKGSGYPLQFPTIEIIEIGAGGGSIARIDDLNLLKIGPESAGSKPGPSSYNLGGIAPTVTDADLILGYLNPNYFLGGSMELNMNLARNSFKKISEILDLSIEETALAVHKIVNENMASAARIHILEKGHDPQNFSMLSFGGAGPVHACGVSNLLGNKSLIVAPSAGVASALGLLVAPTSFDFSQSYPSSLKNLVWNDILEVFENMQINGINLLLNSGLKKKDIQYEYFVSGRFEGQLNEIEITITDMFKSFNKNKLKNKFENSYFNLYNHVPNHTQIELLTWRCKVYGFVSSNKIIIKNKKNININKVKNTRKVYFDNYGYVETPVYNRYTLTNGFEFKGPAIIEEKESTLVIYPFMKGSIDKFLNINVEKI